MAKNNHDITVLNPFLSCLSRIVS